MTSDTMTRRHALGSLAAAGASLLPLAGAAGLAQARPVKPAPGKPSELPRGKPNFVFFLIDDMGWTDAHCFGSTLYDTPNIDKLAASAMRFTDAYAACPVCSPTRASIMTGKYPARLKITNFGTKPVPLAEVTIAEALKAAGYRTFFAGKWHLGGTARHWPDKQGFDINIAGNASGSPRGGHFSPYKNPQLPDGPKGEYLTDRLTDESLKFLDSMKAGGQPFLLYLSHYAVHTPLQGKETLVAKYTAKLAESPPKGPLLRDETPRASMNLAQRNPTFAAMVESVDQSVGRVLAKLDELGLTDNTAVIFMSDNGGLSTLRKNRGALAKNPPTCNLPLRAGKGWLYEGGIREPMLIRWPGVTEAGSTCSVPVTSTDFYPTMLEMAHLPLRPEQHADGVSLASLLQGGTSLDRKAIYWHYPHHHGSGSVPSGAVRCGDWKLIEWYEDKRVELFHLGRDIGETKDLSKSEPAKTAELQSMLKAWRKDIGAVLPPPRKAAPRPAGKRRRKTKTG